MKRLFQEFLINIHKKRLFQESLINIHKNDYFSKYGRNTEEKLKTFEIWTLISKNS